MRTILVVDDEPDILELITFNLERAGYRVTGVTTGEAALEAVGGTLPELVVLDLMLPGINGFDVCRKIKGDIRTQGVPVLMLTARSEDADVVAGLDVGADDYVTKPFNPKVLVARVRAALRRGDATGTNGIATADDLVSVHGITIDVARHEVRCGEESVQLSATEFAILEFLVRNPGWVFSRSKIIDAIRGEEYPVTERSVDVQILGIRRKLGEYGRCIETVRGVGYRVRSV